jgi:hypothetical protein
MVLLKRIQGVLFIMSPSTAGLSHRKLGTSCSSYPKQGQDKGRACGMAHMLGDMLYGSVKGNTGCPFYISEHGRFIS